MDTLTIPENPISVLVVEEEPSILVFLARVLDANGMRAFLARNGSEAVGIAERNYIPIDLILTNAAVLERHDPELLDQLHRIRPGVRDLRMAACVDHGVVRIQLIVGGAGMKTAVCDDGLLESIRKSASTPLVRRAGCLN